MRRKLFTSPFTLIVGICSTAAFAGCGAGSKHDAGEPVPTGSATREKSESITPGTNAPPVTRATGRSNARVELTDCSGFQSSETQITLSVKYRFTAGQPDPLREYTIGVHFVGAPFYESKKILGTQLQKAGEVNWKFQIPDIKLKKNLPIEQIKVTFSEEVSRQAQQTNYAGISGEVTGSFRRD